MWDVETRLTFRRFRVLLDRLPEDSTTRTKMRDAFTDEELLEMAKNGRSERRGHGPLSRHDLFLIDLMDQLKWVEYAIYRSQGGKPNKPEPTPRPGVVQKKKKQGEVKPLNEAGLVHLQELRERGRG